MIYKKVLEDEVFIYMNGVLLYKIWFKNGKRSSILFEKYGPPTRDTDRGK